MKIELDSPYRYRYISTNWLQHPSSSGIGTCIGIDLGPLYTLLKVAIKSNSIGIGVEIGIGQCKRTIKRNGKCHWVDQSTLIKNMVNCYWSTKWTSASASPSAGAVLYSCTLVGRESEVPPLVWLCPFFSSFNWLMCPHSSRHLLNKRPRIKCDCPTIHKYTRFCLKRVQLRQRPRLHWIRRLKPYRRCNNNAFLTESTFLWRNLLVKRKNGSRHRFVKFQSKSRIFPQS